MLYNSRQPNSLFYTPQRVATGANKTLLSIFGKNADGTDNLWGKIGGYIPLVGLGQQVAAQNLVKDNNLTDIKDAVDAGMDNRLQKFQGILGLGQAAVGVATANPSMVMGGLGSAASGIAGGIGSDLYDSRQARPGGISSYQRFEGGGILRGPGPKKTAYVDSVLAANSKLNFVQRYLDPAGHPTIQNPDGTVSTHRMASGDRMVYPTIIQNPDGSLRQLTDQQAYQYAMKTGEYIQFPTEADARWFAENGYKQGTQKSTLPASRPASMGIQRFEAGGILKPGPPAKKGTSRPSYYRQMFDAANEGQQWAIDWFKNRPMMANAQVDYGSIKQPSLRQEYQDPELRGDKWGAPPAGYYMPGAGDIVINADVKRSYGLRSNDEALNSIGLTSAHETTHAVQHITKGKTISKPMPPQSLLDRAIGTLARAPQGLAELAIDAFGGGDTATRRIAGRKAEEEAQRRAAWETMNPSVVYPNPIKTSLDLIDKTPKQNKDPYLNQANEIHARLMEWRKATGTSPTEVITPELYRQRKQLLMRSGKEEFGVRQLYDTLNDKDIINLLNKTAYNSPSAPSGFVQARNGAILGGLQRPYAKTDHTEDALIIDKQTGEPLGEMRRGERILSQTTTIKAQGLARRGDTRGLGRLILNEIKSNASNT